MNIILFDDGLRSQFYPLDLGRPLAHLLTGCYTMEERWQAYSSLPISFQYLTEEYLNLEPKFEDRKEYIYINARLIASREVKEDILQSTKNQSFISDNRLLWIKSSKAFPNFKALNTYAEQAPAIEYKKPFTILKSAWDLFSYNESIIASDIKTLPESYKVKNAIPGVYMDDPSRIYIHPEAKLKPCFLEAQKGYIYIGPNATINMGAMVQGSLVMLKNAELKMGAKIYGSTTLGQHVKIGGEVANVIFFDFSNKGHEGFVGNSVIGSWCNLGADTNSSNLKNNYSKISVWNPYLKKNIDTGLQFLGVLMGDHCKLGINTMLNTGTVIGTHSNIFGAGFPNKFIPSFYWGGAETKDRYDFDKAMQTAERMMARRRQVLTEKSINVYKHIFKNTHL